MAEAAVGERRPCKVCGHPWDVHAPAEVVSVPWAKGPVAYKAVCAACPFGADFHAYQEAEA